MSRDWTTLGDKDREVTVEDLDITEDSPWKGIPHKPTGFIGEAQTMQVYTSVEMANRLKKAASKLGVSRSELVRMAVRTFMEDNGLWSITGPERKR